MGTAGAATAALGLPSRSRAADRRLNIAVIGANGKGRSDTQNVALEHNIVALVDVDSVRLDEAAAGLSKYYSGKGVSGRSAPRLYADYRKMFDEMGRGIDGVIVSTPDHTHYVAALQAIKAGKHVCVQKPLCNTLAETRSLHKAAREARVVTQMGNQGRTMEGQRIAKEWIEQGFIGDLQEVRLWTNRPIWPQGPLGKKRIDAPGHLNWDLWLSSEADEPYFAFEAPLGVNTRRGTEVHPFNWRGWWQYGCGALGDMGCHIMDATFSILGRQTPVRVEVESSPITALHAPVWTRLVYHMAPYGGRPPIKVTWHDGSRDGAPHKPERDARVPAAAFDKASSGMMFIGSEGVVFEGEAYCSSPAIYPDERARAAKEAAESGRLKKTEKRSPHPGNPQLEWAHCIVDGGSPSSNFDYSVPLTEFVLLGNLAVRSEMPIEWDQQAGRVTNAPEANRFIHRRDYRKGWM